MIGLNVNKFFTKESAMEAQINDLTIFRTSKALSSQSPFPILVERGIVVGIDEFFEREFSQFKSLALFVEGQEASIVLSVPDEIVPSLRIFAYVREIQIPVTGKTFVLTGLNRSTSGPHKDKPGVWIVTFTIEEALPARLYLEKPALSLGTSQHTVHNLINEA